MRNRGRHISIIVFIIYLTMSASSLHAQKFALGFDVALVEILESDKGAGIYLNGEYLFNKNVGIGFELGLLERSRYVEDSAPPIEGETDRWTFTLNGIYFLNAHNKVKPYGSLAAGMASFKVKDGENVNGVIEYSTNTQYSFTLKPEIGVRVGWFNAGIAYSYIGSYESPWDNEKLDFSAMEYSVGLRCNIGQ